jgi:hypothetical protein
MSRARLVVAIVLIHLLSACQRAEDRTIARRVTPPDLVGTWRITKDGLEGLRFGGHNANLVTEAHRIELRADSTCTYTSVVEPCLAADPAGSSLVAADTPCAWQLATNGRYQEVTLSLTPRPNHERGLHFYITEEGGQLHLFWYICDPDQWHYFEFSR